MVFDWTGAPVFLQVNSPRFAHTTTVETSCPAEIFPGYPFLFDLMYRNPYNALPVAAFGMHPALWPLSPGRQTYRYMKGEDEMSYCTAINCMDGRSQSPVIEYLCKRFNVRFVDMITEPGPDLILANNEDESKIESIFSRCDISVEKHLSAGIAIVGHHDCIGNPAEEEEQRAHIEKAIAVLQHRYKDKEIIGLWLDNDFRVHELPAR